MQTARLELDAVHLDAQVREPRGAVGDRGLGQARRDVGQRLRLRLSGPAVQRETDRLLALDRDAGADVDIIGVDLADPVDERPREQVGRVEAGRLGREEHLPAHEGEVGGIAEQQQILDGSRGRDPG